MSSILSRSWSIWSRWSRSWSIWSIWSRLSRSWSIWSISSVRRVDHYRPRQSSSPFFFSMLTCVPCGVFCLCIFQNATVSVLVWCGFWWVLLILIGNLANVLQHHNSGTHSYQRLVHVYPYNTQNDTPHPRGRHFAADFSRQHRRWKRLAMRPRKSRTTYFQSQHLRSVCPLGFIETWLGNSPQGVC